MYIIIIIIIIIIIVDEPEVYEDRDPAQREAEGPNIVKRASSSGSCKASATSNS